MKAARYSGFMCTFLSASNSSSYLASIVAIDYTLFQLFGCIFWAFTTTVYLYTNPWHYTTLPNNYTSFRLVTTQWQGT